MAAIQEVADQSLPQGYGFEFSGLSREEQSSSNQIGGILVLCLVFVYFILCALYESYILPLSVILSLPLGLSGSFLFARMMGADNDIYLQTALIMLIGLLAKNAILIVQFALARRQQGETIVQAAIDGASARLRPILMTSLAMVIGLLPLMFATGVGANGNRTIGARCSRRYADRYDLPADRCSDSVHCIPKPAGAFQEERSGRSGGIITIIDKT